MTGYPLAGACACGAVSYRLMRAPMFINCCHCRDCQTQTGGAFAINAIVERDQIALAPASAQPACVPMPTQSGRPHDVYRCPICQTALWSDYGGRGVTAFLRVSTLEAAHDLKPDAHIFTRSKVPWVVLPPGARAFEIYYDMQKEWPAESLARRRAVLDGG